MKIILHIGTEKTGTTSLQSFLYSNRDRLAAQGVCYPSCLGGHNHTYLAFSALPRGLARFDLDTNGGDRRDLSEEDFRIALFDDLAKECRGCRLMILSNEHCSSRLELHENIENLRRMLLRISDDIDIALYLRRQDEFLLSSYSTELKSGGVRQLQIPGAQEFEFRYNYKALIERWEAVFGKCVDVRRYSRTELFRANLIDDFCHYFNLETEGMPRVEDLNCSLSMHQAEFLRRMNKRFRATKESIRSDLHDDILKYVQRLVPTGGKIRLPEQDMIRFMDRFRETNGWVSDRYFGGRKSHGDPLFGESEPNDYEEVEHLDVEQSFRMFAEMLTMIYSGFSQK